MASSQRIAYVEWPSSLETDSGDIKLPIEKKIGYVKLVLEITLR
jgi:hypothetical protein